MNEVRNQDSVESHASRKRRLLRFRGRAGAWLSGFAVAALIAVVAVITLQYAKSSDNTATPKQVLTAKNQAGFSIYYPETLPAGFRYGQDTASVSAETVSYAVSDKTGAVVTVNIQPKPQGVQFDDFYDRLLANRVDVTSAYGKAVTGEAGGKMIGSLMDDKVWVLLSAEKSLDAKVMHDLVAGLKPVR